MEFPNIFQSAIEIRKEINTIIWRFRNIDFTKSSTIAIRFQPGNVVFEQKVEESVKEIQKI